jgi:hypothetical protein
MNWVGLGRKLMFSVLRYYPNICLEELGKSKETSLRMVGFSDRDSNTVLVRFSAILSAPPGLIAIT